MVTTFKLLVIAFLVGLNIILCSVFTGLHLIYIRRYAYYEAKRRRKTYHSLGTKQEIRSTHDKSNVFSLNQKHSESLNESSPDTSLKSITTIRSSTPPYDLHSKNSRPHSNSNKARHSNDISTISEAHWKQALLLMPLEWDIVLHRSNYLTDNKRKKRKVADFVLKEQKRKKIEHFKLSSRKKTKQDQQNESSIYIRQFVKYTWEKLTKWVQGGNALIHKDEWKRIKEEDVITNSKRSEEALYHLQKAAQLGNHYAQNMLANMLASGILPATNILGTNHSSSRQALVVPTDFAYGGEQLAQAIILWHMSAMQGNIEAAMALGFRHEYSAAMGQYPSKIVDTATRPLVHNEDVTATLKLKRWNTMSTKSDDKELSKSSFMPSRDKALPLGHSANPTNHYGVLGTCESAMLYYEAAANSIMDELEASPLRGKVSPAMDRHNLAQIQMRGTSSALEYADKPDESEEAIQYYRMKASRKNQVPDVNAAYTLAQYYHYGIRGIQQSMAIALHYYEIAADHSHWEAAGQAGKFHLWMMGVDENARNLNKAFNYFKMGMPGGLSECRYRFEARSNKKARVLDSNGNIDDDGDIDSENDFAQCDHPSINGMGLLHVFGVPDLVPIDIPLAKEHFNLAKEMGNMDAFYNLAMLSLGWSNDSHVKHDEMMKNLNNYNEAGSGPTKADFHFAQDNFARAATMGHVQAKHRLAMMYARGIYVYNEPNHNKPFEVIPENCQKALSLFKEIADNGTTMSRRLRTAYKQFMNGQFENSLRNYLAAAESGSEIAQINAAFLLEQGHCLGMTHNQCMKASLRMWRAAARQGSEEACLRIGDFFYYGREYGDIEILDSYTERQYMYRNSPFPWIQYLVYPEDLLQGFVRHIIPHITLSLRRLSSEKSKKTPICNVGTYSSDASCSAIYNITNETLHHNHTRDLAIAVQYYRQAAEQHGSPRANFNLGTMYEWGMGLRQDFPMAKRHYDLAGTARSKEAAVAVQLALFCMNVHESVVRWKLYIQSKLPGLLNKMMA